MKVLPVANKNESKEILEFVVATAAAVYNAGHVGNINTLFGISYSRYIDKHLKSLDKAIDFPLKSKMRNKQLQQDLRYESGSF